MMETTFTTYTSKETWDDYDDAKTETLRLMNDAEEDTSMEQDGNVVYYKKRVHDRALENNSDAYWYECYSRRVETVIVQETGRIIERKTFEDIEYYGTATDGKSHWVHKITIEEPIQPTC